MAMVPRLLLHALLKQACGVCIDTEEVCCSVQTNLRCTATISSAVGSAS